MEAPDPPQVFTPSATGDVTAQDTTLLPSPEEATDRTHWHAQVRRLHLSEARAHEQTVVDDGDVS